MACFILITVLIGLPVLTALVSGLVFYAQFRKCPEKRWQERVLGLLAAAMRRADVEKKNLCKIISDYLAEAGRQKEEAFRAYLADISVRELEAYTGIGPATVAKLRVAGYLNLAALRYAQLRIHGLGEKRLTDIDFGVRDLLQRARGAFDAGACPQASSLPKKLERLSDECDFRQAEARACVHAAEEVRERLRGPEAVAHQVTFWRWFRPRLEENLAPQEVMDAPLPDLNAIMRNAESRVAKAWEAKRRGLPASGRQNGEVLPVAPAPLPPIFGNSAIPCARIAETAHASVPNWAADMSEDVHLLMMELTIQFVLAAARADGPVTSAEQELINRHLRQRFSYDRALLNRAEAFCAHYRSAAIDLDRCLQQIKEKFTAAHRTALIDFAGQIVAVSSNGGPAGATFLRSLAQRLGVSPVAMVLPGPSAKPAAAPPPTPGPSRPVAPAATRPASVGRAAVAASPIAPRSAAVASALPPRFVGAAPPAVICQAAPARIPAPGPTHEECLALLEIPPAASVSADLVRRQCNLLSERLDPTKAASMGPEFMKMAKAKRSAVRQAAESLLKSMGEKLEVNPPAPASRDLRYNPDLDDVFGGM